MRFGLGDACCGAEHLRAIREPGRHRSLLITLQKLGETLTDRTGRGQFGGRDLVKAKLVQRRRKGPREARPVHHRREHSQASVFLCLMSDSRRQGLLAEKAVGRESRLHESRKGELVGQHVQSDTVNSKKSASTRGECARDLVAGLEMGAENEDLSFSRLLFEPAFGLLEAPGRRRGPNDASFWHSRTACYQPARRFAPLIFAVSRTFD